LTNSVSKLCCRTKCLGGKASKLPSSVRGKNVCIVIRENSNHAQALFEAFTHAWTRGADTKAAITNLKGMKSFGSEKRRKKLPRPEGCGTS